MTHKLAFFLPSLVGGGAEKVSVNLLKEMTNHEQLKLELVLGKAYGAFIDEVPNEVSVIDFNRKRILSTIWPLVRYIKTNKPDYLVAHISHTNIIAIIAKKISRSNVKLIVVEHNNLTARNRKNRRSYITRPLMRWLYPHADTIIGVSNGVSQDITTKLGLEQGRVSTVYNPVAVPELYEKANELPNHPWLLNKDYSVYIGIGRFTEQKDFTTLLHAFAIVQKSVTAKLILLGDGPLREDLTATAEELGISKLVSMPGFTDNPYSYLRHSSCFVLSSRYEGLPTVLIEAIACGCTVVATDCPSGPNEILENGKFGKLVPIGDAQSLADAMIYSLSNPTPKTLLTRRAGAFTPTNIAPIFLKTIGIQN